MCGVSGGWGVSEFITSKQNVMTLRVDFWPHSHPFAVDGVCLTQFSLCRVAKFSLDSWCNKEDHTEDSVDRLRMFFPVSGE